MSVAALAKARDAVFGRVFELSLVKTYVSRWGLVQAVRELIQNAVDSQSPFDHEFIPEENPEFSTLRLTSAFSTLTPQMLLLGATSKEDDPDAIGSFGEGFKIALLVLTRLGHFVDVWNGDALWRPRFRFSRTFGDEILVIEESALDAPNKGLTFLVRGLSNADVVAIRESCLLMRKIPGEIKHTEYGEILIGLPGKLYVGGLHVCDTEMKHGYNFKPRHLKLDRDRQTVASWDLKLMTLRAWYATGEHARVAEMIAAQVPDVEYSSYDAPELVKEECYRIFREQNPGAVIASSPEDMRAKIEAGMTRTVYVGGGMYHAVSSSRSYAAERSVIERPVPSPAAQLRAFFSEHRGEMRRPAVVAFKELIARAERWRDR